MRYPAMPAFADPSRKIIQPPAIDAPQHARTAPAGTDVDAGRTEPEVARTGAAALHTTSAQLAKSPGVQRLAQLRSQMNGRTRGGRTTAEPAGRQAGRRSVTSTHAPVQRYFRVGHNRLTATRGATFPSQEIVNGVPTTTTKTRVRGGQVRAVTSSYDSANRNWQAAAPVVAANQPPMNVSAGSELAIEATQGNAQATAFYATAAAINASNTALANVGSPVRLAGTAHSITVPTNPDPNALDPTPKTLYRTAGATHVPANHPSAEAGRLLDVLFDRSNCDDVVDKIVRPGQRAVVVGAGANRAPAPYRGFEPGDQIGAFVAAHPGTQNVAGLAAAASHPAAQPVDPTAQANYRNEIQNHGEPHAALGLNRHAAPQVGEAFFISSLAHDNTVLRDTTSFAPGTTDVNDQYRAALQALAAVGAHADVMQSAVTAAQKTLRAVWSNHYAGVIARDGADAVTMENYARSKERNWNILATFNDLYRQFAEFRRFVRTKTMALASQDAEQLKGLIRSALADSVNAASEVHGHQVELQQALQAITQDADALDASMLHFRMYGPQPGQTFHEQFRGSTANPLTMTLATSLPAMVAHERTETQTICNACISALSLGTPNAAINAALLQERNAVVAAGAQRMLDLTACANIQDVMRVLQARYLWTAYNGAVERVRAEAAAAVGGPGLFAAPTHSGALQNDLDAAIQNNAIGRDPRGRDGRIQVKRELQALKRIADALHAIHIHE